MKKIIFYTLLCVSFWCYSQVGINTTEPNAQLDVRSSSQANPTNTDGLLIPKIDNFPATNPGVDQNGMMVFLTTTVGSNTPGFYYWEAVGNTWIPIKGNEGGTLDQAYNFGGPGAGNTIIADAGAVTIAGTDGLVSTGTLGTGALPPSGEGVRMVWNPGKAAFRAGGIIFGTQWNNVNIGDYSTAFGLNTTASGAGSFAFGDNSRASGSSSTAFGLGTTASAFGSTAFGFGNTASANLSTAFGGTTTASGIISTAFGNSTTASGFASTSYGIQNTASSYAETVIGIGATNYTPSANGATQFRTANAADRLFVIGNAIDTNNNNAVDDTERSDAMIVLKNGLTRLPSMDNAMIDAGDGKTVVIKEYLQSNEYGWLTTGNTGLSAATNFIGTTNTVDVIFRRNNERAGRLGVSNTSFGVNALNPNVSEGFNTAVGSAALQNIANGNRNAAFGSVSLNANISGDSNTALGVDALSLNETGNNNTAVGRRAMGFTGALTTGSNNTALGYFAYSTGNFTNSTALGANTAITASNQIRVGNSAVTSIGGTVGFTDLSDGRFKRNIQADVPGLAFIQRLKPVTYQMDMESLARFLNTPQEARDREAERARESTPETGFIAQEVEQAARETGFVFSGVDAPKNNSDYYGLRYASFVVPLVKAIQEQQQIIEDQKTEILLLKQQLEKQYNELLVRVTQLERN